MLYLYNTLKRQKELFTPINPECIKIYVCGPTVYNHIHIGNARAMIVFDVLYRALKQQFNQVIYVRNITDIDDKIINKSKELKINITEIVEIFSSSFADDMNVLNCLLPDYQPKVSEHINEIILVIQKLINNNHAYVVDGEVYFDIQSFPEYGKLSMRDIKNDAENNFVLWKADKNNLEYLFDSPWGKGRPGWHIECSAMSWKYLGENFDIHGGGQDLCFPHHDNEIAQNKCAFPGSKFANFWVHNGFVNLAEEKMSKSLGNIVRVKDLLENYRGEVIRYALLMTHYRKILNWHENILDIAQEDLNRFYRALEDYKYEHDQISEEVKLHINDDLNIPFAIKALHNLVTEINKSGANKNFLQNILKNSGLLLGILCESYENWFKMNIDEQEINSLIEQRAQAKVDKNYLLADQIRSKLKNMSIEVIDMPDGSYKWRKC